MPVCASGTLHCVRRADDVDEALEDPHERLLTVFPASAGGADTLSS